MYRTAQGAECSHLKFCMPNGKTHWHQTHPRSCCKREGSKSHSEYEYYIEISRYTLNNPEKSIRNTLIHELLHTVPDGMRHTGAWKKWAKYVSSKTGYTIQRLAENKNE